MNAPFLKEWADGPLMSSEERLSMPADDSAEVSPSERGAGPRLQIPLESCSPRAEPARKLSSVVEEFCDGGEGELLRRWRRQDWLANRSSQGGGNLRETVNEGWLRGRAISWSWRSPGRQPEAAVWSLPFNDQRVLVTHRKPAYS